MLLTPPGALVTKDTFYAALWPGEAGDDGNNLNQVIFRIRRTLDPAGDGRAFVETVPRPGNRAILTCEMLVALHAGRYEDARAAIDQLQGKAAAAPAGGEPRGAAAAGY
jgi:DNA-binding winged helix-turn-helix (wHTH) protein